MRKTLLTLSLAATALASPVLAQRMGPDANKDGVVTRAEATAQADARFARMDADRNGTVTPDERRAARQAMSAQRDARVVTAAEFQQRAQARFARLDANRDGQLTGEERRAGHRGRMGHHGMRGPGRGGPGMERPSTAKDMTAADFRTRALARFDRIDANRDGRIDQAERVAARGRMGPPPGGQRPPVAN